MKLDEPRYFQQLSIHKHSIVSIVRRRGCQTADGLGTAHFVKNNIAHGCSLVTDCYNCQSSLIWLWMTCMVSTFIWQCLYVTPYHLASPGCFFAAITLKAMMAHLMLTYDIKLENEGVWPPDTWLGAYCVPNQKAKVLFRKCQIWWDLVSICPTCTSQNASCVCWKLLICILRT